MNIHDELNLVLHSHQLFASDAIFRYAFHGFFMDFSWIFHGFFMDFSWIFHGFVIDCSWIFHGFFIDFSWIFHGISLVYQWINILYGRRFVPWTRESATPSCGGWPKRRCRRAARWVPHGNNMEKLGKIWKHMEKTEGFCVGCITEGLCRMSFWKFPNSTVWETWIH